MLIPVPENASGLFAKDLEPDHILLDANTSFGDYELLNEIARGGMGIVYQARHRRLNRIIALKMILSSPLAGEPAARRFRAEAEAAASLDHPNIVPIYEVGEADGRLFYTMKLVEGGSLASPKMGPEKWKVDGGNSGRHAAELLAKVARGVHHAHERGLLHRDLKPSNILLDAAGEPAVADFGLARWLEEDSDLTGSGAVVGSPNYMSPEQAAGHARELTTAADVYSLGAVLFFLLTGRAPFAEATAVATLRAVIEREPPGPASLNPAVPRDLDTICRKCLAKDPGSRYTSAQSLAADLDRWRAGEPIQARPIGAWEQAVKWARRNPAWALLIMLLFVTPAVIIFLLLAGNSRVRQAQSLTHLNLYAADMQGAQTALEEADLALARKILGNYAPRPGEPDPRGFEWRYLSHRARSGQLRVLRGHSEPVNCLAFSKDGNWLAASEAARAAWFWNTTTWKPESKIDWSGQSQNQFRWVSFSRNADLVALTTDSEMPDVAANEQHCVLFDAQRMEPLLVMRAPYVRRGFAQRMLWSPVSDKVAFLAAGGPEGRFVGVLDWQSFKANPGRRSSNYADGIICEYGQSNFGSFPDAPVLRLPGVDALLNFTSEGELLALRDGQLVRFDIEHGGASSPIFSAHSFDYCERSLDGRFLAGFNSRPKDRHSILMDEFTPTVTNYWEMIGHEGDVLCLAISPNSRQMVSGSADHTACVWDVASRKPVAKLRGHADEVAAVAWSPDGKMIATGSLDRTVMLWGIDPTNQNEGLPEPITGALGPWLAAQDGALLVATAPANDTTPHQTLLVWDLAQRQRIELPAIDSSRARPSALGGEKSRAWGLTPLYLSGSRHELLTIQESGGGQFDLRSWDLASRTNALLRTVSIPGSRAASLLAPLWAMSPDRGWVARSAEKGIVNLWRVDASGEEPSVLAATGAPVTQLSFSPDSASLAVGHTYQGKRTSATVWRLGQKPQASAVIEFPTVVNAVVWSPDGVTLAAGCQDHTIQIRKAAKDRLGVTLAGHKRSVTSLDYSPDGQTLASSDGRTIKLWHVPTGREMFSIYRDPKIGDPVMWIGFTHDGTRLLAADQGGRVQIFLAPPLSELAEIGAP
jgi:WD40 repeat protein